MQNHRCLTGQPRSCTHLPAGPCPGLPTQFSSVFTRRCLKHSHCPTRRAVDTVVRAAQIKPAYNKYRSREEIDQDYVRQWKETTARDARPRRLTPFTFLWFVPVFAKYHLIPGTLRFVWWLIWTSLLSATYQLRKRLILQGVKLDVQLMKSGNSVGLTTFSKQLALERLHGKAGFLSTLKYRIAVYQIALTTECEQGKDLTEFFKPRDQLDSKQETDVEDSEVELGHAEYFNQNLPDLGAFVKEEPGSTDGDAENVEQPQPVPA